jgi:hypothetical protein
VTGRNSTAGFKASFMIALIMVEIYGQLYGSDVDDNNYMAF